ncbi:hypothetical protein IFR05_002330 [Cadophora sp. M221]|nr:hypothetical protein IFR05_002330 [Cadophora sp. M221]
MNSQLAIRAQGFKPLFSPAPIEQDETGFFDNATKSILLLLRGLFAGGVLAFALGQKRWRVNFGLTSRNPPTLLAVPYRAKDSPAPYAKFSHPNIVITLTCLSYYYGRLLKDECEEFEVLAFGSAILQEEQERELAPEIEQERQVERPP